MEHKNRYAFRKPVIIGDIARVTLSTKSRTIAPGYIIARVELAGAFNIVSTRMTQPRIVAQGESGEWMTWESRLLRDDEPDSTR